MCVLFYLYTGYGDFDGRRVIDSLDGVGKLLGSLDAADCHADRLSRLVITVVPLDCSQFADVLRSTVVVLHPRRRTVVERSLELCRRHENVVRDFVNDGSAPTKLFL